MRSRGGVAPPAPAVLPATPTRLTRVPSHFTCPSPRPRSRKFAAANGPNKVKEDKFMDGFNVAAASC
jgi:hypothetical protein